MIIRKTNKKALTFMTITSIVQQCWDYLHHKITKVFSSVVIELHLLDYICIPLGIQKQNKDFRSMSRRIRFFGLAWLNKDAFFFLVVYINFLFLNMHACVNKSSIR